MFNKRKIDAVSEGASEAIHAKQNQQIAEELEQQKREKLIAQCHELIGRTQVSSLIGKFGAVTSLMSLRQLKESKIYRDIPGVGTWEKLCNYLGMSRRKVDEDLQNLDVLGEEFLATCRQFSLGYKDLRKLRKSVAAGEITIGSECLEVNGEKIPFDADHKEDLEAAIERVIEQKEEKIQELKKLENNKDKIIEEETKALKTERDALIKENQRLKIFDPEAQGDKDITWCEEQIKEIYKACTSFAVLCQKFIIDDRLRGDMPGQARVEGFMTEAEMALAELRRRWTDYFIPDDEMM